MTNLYNLRKLTHLNYWLHGLSAGLLIGLFNALMLGFIAFSVGSVTTSTLPIIIPLVSTMGTWSMYVIITDFSACALGGALGGLLFRLLTGGVGTKATGSPIRIEKIRRSFWHVALPPAVRAILLPTLPLQFAALCGYTAITIPSVLLGQSWVPIFAYSFQIAVYVINGLMAGWHARHTWSFKA